VVAFTQSPMYVMIFKSIDGELVNSFTHSTTFNISIEGTQLYSLMGFIGSNDYRVIISFMTSKFFNARAIGFKYSFGTTVPAS